MATIARPATSLALVVMLTAAVLLNYVDRGAVGIAAPLMKQELGLSATGFGIAVSAFFWVYAPVQLVLGWLCDRFCVYRLFAIGLALWAISTTLTALVPGIEVLILLRVLLGLGESIAFPGSSKIIANQVPDAQRGMANALIAAAIAFGPAVGTLAGGLILEAHGWRAVFGVFGVVTILWLLPWSRISAPYRAAATERTVAPYPLAGLFKRGTLWLMGLAHFCSNYPFYFLLAWLPLYLVQSRGLSIPTMTSIATATFVVQGIAALSLGWLSDRWVANGSDEGIIRRRLMAASQVVVAVSIIAVAMAETLPVMTAWLMIASAAGGVIAGNIFAVGQIFAGKRAVGSWIGIQNALGNISGIVGPIITGLIIDLSGRYVAAFALTAAVSALGAVLWLFVIPKVEPIIDRPA